MLLYPMHAQLNLINDSLLQLCSLSLSLDSLLDYTDKDFEESTFEVCFTLLSLVTYAG